jgi:hypothetical protein
LKTCNGNGVHCEESQQSVVTPNHTNINYNLQNSTIQNHIQTQNNIEQVVIMNFGNEKIDHITDEMKDRWLQLLNGRGIMKAIEHVHFLPDRPENHNIILDGKDRKILKVFQNDKWTRRGARDVTDQLIDNGRRMLMERYVESPIQEQDRETRTIYTDIILTDKRRRPEAYYNVADQIIAQIIDITEQRNSKE